MPGTININSTFGIGIGHIIPISFNPRSTISIVSGLGSHCRSIVLDERNGQTLQGNLENVREVLKVRCYKYYIHENRPFQGSNFRKQRVYYIDTGYDYRPVWENSPHPKSLSSIQERGLDSILIFEVFSSLSLTRRGTEGEVSASSRTLVFGRFNFNLISNEQDFISIVNNAIN